MKIKNISVDDVAVIQFGGTFKAIFAGEVLELPEAEGHAALKAHAAILKEDKGVSAPKVKIEPEVK